MNKKNGFTLVEVLVAIAIFSTAIMVVFSIFVNSQNLQQRTLAIQRGQSDARYALELMLKEFRLGEVDYEYSGYAGGISSPVSELSLRNNQGVPVRFKLEGGVIKICNSFSQEGINQNESESCTSWSAITPTNITIDRLDFYIDPEEDPYDLDELTGLYAGGDKQEFLTIVLESTVFQNKGDDYQVKFQTSVSSRVYKR